jgi:signal transduction histidine kinase
MQERGIKMDIMRRTILGLCFTLMGFLIPGPTIAAERGSAEEAKQMVAKAVELFKQRGEAAFADINETGNFREKDLYVFVHSTGPDATVVAYGGPPVDPAPLGRKSIDIKDADGKPIGQMFQQTAIEEGAWVDYRWMNPVTKIPEEKSSWLVRSGGYIFGCGIYK